MSQKKIHSSLQFSFKNILNIHINLIEVQEINKLTYIKTSLYNIITLKKSIYFFPTYKIQRVLTYHSDCKTIFYGFV